MNRAIELLPVRAEPFDKLRTGFVEAHSRTSPTLRHGAFAKLSPLLRANGWGEH